MYYELMKSGKGRVESGEGKVEKGKFFWSHREPFPTSSKEERHSAIARDTLD
jgi:hypothetical protein